MRSLPRGGKHQLEDGSVYSQPSPTSYGVCVSELDRNGAAAPQTASRRFESPLPLAPMQVSDEQFL